MSHKTRTVSRLFHSHWRHLLALYWQKWQISYPFHVLQRVKSLRPFDIPKAWKRCPFWVEPPNIGPPAGLAVLKFKEFYSLSLIGSKIGSATGTPFSLPWDVIETHLYQSKQQCKVNIVEPLLWDTSFQEKPPFMGHKIWSWKNVLILIFVPVTHDMKGHFCSRKSDTFPRSPNLGLTSIQVQWNTALWLLHYYGQFFSA